MFYWLRKSIYDWVYRRYYKARVDFRTSIKSGELLLYDGDMIRLADINDDLPFYLAQSDGTFVKLTGAPYKIDGYESYVKTEASTGNIFTFKIPLEDEE